MQNDYNRIIQERADHVFEVMAKRVSAEDMERIHAAFELAREAHAPQKRKTGEPYILHPIAVANIAAEELMLGANPVIACFLHDVVEDTPYTIEDIRERFGDDVAFLVKVVTKKPTHDYELSKQLDNYRQLLNSMQYDIRAILVKLADRLHNMRTLASMKPEKQMKIAGETDYFYAPLANRLGLYNIKTELENLSFRFRCPDEYEEISSLIERHVEANKDNLETFRSQIAETLSAAGTHSYPFFGPMLKKLAAIAGDGGKLPHYGMLGNRRHSRHTGKSGVCQRILQFHQCIVIIPVSIDHHKNRSGTVAFHLPQTRNGSIGNPAAIRRNCHDTDIFLHK